MIEKKAAPSLPSRYKTHFEELKIDTHLLNKTEIPDIRWKNITSDIARAVAFSGISEGAVIIHVKHTTAALVLNEDEQGLIESDLPLTFRRLCPEGKYEHDKAERILALPPGEPKNAPGHLRSIIGGHPSVTLVVHNSGVQLGAWQAVLFFDFDPESHPGRTIVVRVMGE